MKQEAHILGRAFKESTMRILASGFLRIGIAAGLVVLTGLQVPTRAFGQDSSESSIDPIQGVTITVAAGVALSANSYKYRRQIEASNQLHTRQGTVITGTGADLVPRRGEDAAKLANWALEGTRHGDILTIEYTPGTVAELRNAVSDLEGGEKLWEKRVIELSKEMGRLNRRITVEKHNLAKLRLSADSRDERDRTQSRLDKLEREFRYVRNAELDAQQRRLSARRLFAEEKKNLELAERTGKMVRTHVHLDLPVGDNTHGYLQGFISRVATSDGNTSVREAKLRAPFIRISRVALPNLEKSIQLLKEARRGAWVAGIGAIVALEEIAVGYMSDGLREGLEATDLIQPRNSGPAATVK